MGLKSTTIANQESDWRGRLESRQHAEHDWGTGRDEGLVRAAVLVPMVWRDAAPELVFTERSRLLRSHKGQISFPGGRCEASDRSPVDTALREVEEEIHVPRDRVRVLGRLDDSVTSTGYRVSPVVGVIEVQGENGAHRWKWNVDEIADVFTVPIAVLRDGAVFHPEGISVEYQGVKMPFFAFTVGERKIWGVTGRIVMQFLEVLFDWAPPVESQTP